MSHKRKVYATAPTDGRSVVCVFVAQKSVGTALAAHPTYRGSRIARYWRTSNANSPRRYGYSPSHFIQKRKGAYIHIPRTSAVALLWQYRSNLRDSYTSKTRRLKTPFYMSRLSVSHPKPASGRMCPSLWNLPLARRRFALYIWAIPNTSAMPKMIQVLESRCKVTKKNLSTHTLREIILGLRRKLLSLPKNRALCLLT